MKFDPEFSLRDEGTCVEEAPPVLSPSAPVTSPDLLTSMMQQLIDDLPEEIALLDRDLRIVSVNQAWRAACLSQGYFNVGPGDNYRQVCEARAAQGYQPAAAAMIALTELAEGKRQSWQLDYNGGDLWNGRDYRVSAHCIRLGNRSLILVTREDVTELVELRRIRSDFADSVLREQAEERRRLGRELHDSTSQLLACVSLLLGRLRRESIVAPCTAIVDELQELLSEAQQEIRSISLLTSPPPLERMGLTEALSTLVEGLARRTGLKTQFEVSGEPSPLGPGPEAAVYRVAQEALSNVQRHAHAKQSYVSLCFRKGAVHLIVTDDGCGISPAARVGIGTAGVGLASMRSRLAELDGRLSIRKLNPGTAIIATVRHRDLAACKGAGQPKAASPFNFARRASRRFYQAAQPLP